MVVAAIDDDAAGQGNGSQGQEGGGKDDFHEAIPEMFGYQAVGAGFSSVVGAGFSSLAGGVVCM